MSHIDPGGGIPDTSITLSALEVWARKMREKHGDLPVALMLKTQEHGGVVLTARPKQVFVANPAEIGLCDDATNMAWLVNMAVRAGRGSR